MGMPRKPCHACHGVTFNPPTAAAQLRKICSSTDAQKSVLPTLYIRSPPPFRRQTADVKQVQNPSCRRDCLSPETHNLD